MVIGTKIVLIFKLFTVITINHVFLKSIARQLSAVNGLVDIMCFFTGEVGLIEWNHILNYLALSPLITFEYLVFKEIKRFSISRYDKPANITVSSRHDNKSNK